MSKAKAAKKRRDQQPDPAVPKRGGDRHRGGHVVRLPDPTWHLLVRLKQETGRKYVDLVAEAVEKIYVK